METNERDDVLVRAAKGGDKEAFAVLFGRHQPLLLGLCRKALADPVLAEDAAQEAAITALLNVDCLRREDRFGPWLGGIGLNICRRMLRERGRDGWSWDAVVGGRRTRETSETEPGPEALAEAAEVAERTRNAIAVLPPGQRSAIVLFYLSGLSHAETADLLGIEIGAVKTRLHKARRTLKRQLSDNERHETVDERLTRRTLAKTAAALGGSAALGHGTPAQARRNKGEIMAGLVEMRVADVRRKHAESGTPASHVVLLEEVAGTRRLPIWVGEAEGTSIAIQLEGATMPRPLAVAFAANLLHAAGGKLREVRIDRLVDTVFYATAVIEGNETTSTIDARPSDAINLALLSGAAINVDGAILESESSTLDMSDQTTTGRSEIVAEFMAR